MIQYSVLLDRCALTHLLEYNPVSPRARFAWEMAPRFFSCGEGSVVSLYTIHG
jgi:hypothetical protein